MPKPAKAESCTASCAQCSPRRMPIAARLVYRMPIVIIVPASETRSCRHERQQPRVDGVELRAAQADKRLIIRHHDVGRGDRQGQRAAHQHAQAHEQRPEPVLLGRAAGLSLLGQYPLDAVREQQRIVDPLGQPRSTEDEARLDRDKIGAEFEQIEGVGGLVDAAAGDDDELGAEVIAEPRARHFERLSAPGHPARGGRRHRAPIHPRPRPRCPPRARGRRAARGPNRPAPAARR